MFMSSKRKDCKTCLKVYYGIGEYNAHQSRFSAQFMHYINTKYGTKMVEECKKEVKDERGVSESSDKL